MSETATPPWAVTDERLEAAVERLVVAARPSRVLLACIGNPDPGGMKVYAPAGEETFNDAQTTEEAQARADRREAA